VYQVLQPVTEESGQSGRPIGPTENAGGLWDIATPQLGLTAGPMALAGCKCSAMSAAPDDGHHGPISRKLASAADFSPTHFGESTSDGLILLMGPSQQNPDPTLPMRTGLDAPAHTPTSSPILQNLLLWREDPMDIQTPSPMR